MLDRAAEIRRGRRVVDDQRDAGAVGDGCDRRQVGDVAAGVGDGLAEDRSGVVVDRAFDRCGVVEVDERGRPAEALDRLRELGDRSSVQTGRDDHVLARTHQREQRQDLGGVAGRAGDGTGTALECGDTVLQRPHRRVREPRVDEADLLEVEEPGGVVGVLELEGRRLEDRGLDRSHRVGLAATVEERGVEAVLGCVTHVQGFLRSGVRMGRGDSTRRMSHGAGDDMHGCRVCPLREPLRSP